jgi:hypothetical protein
MCRTASSLILYQARLMQFTSNLILSPNLCFHPLNCLVPSVFGLKFYMHVNSLQTFYVPAIIHDTPKSGKQYKLSSCSLLSNFPPFLLLPISCIHILSLTSGSQTSSNSVLSFPPDTEVLFIPTSLTILFLPEIIRKGNIF